MRVTVHARAHGDILVHIAEVGSPGSPNPFPCLPLSLILHAARRSPSSFFFHRALAHCCLAEAGGGVGASSLVWVSLYYEAVMYDPAWATVLPWQKLLTVKCCVRSCSTPLWGRGLKARLQAHHREARNGLAANVPVALHRRSLGLRVLLSARPMNVRLIFYLVKYFFNMIDITYLNNDGFTSNVTKSKCSKTSVFVIMQVS